jgi:hypothetical protein
VAANAGADGPVALSTDYPSRDTLRHQSWLDGHCLEDQRATLYDGDDIAHPYHAAVMICSGPC